MAIQEAPELTFYHEEIKSIATYGTMPSGRNLEISWATPTHWVNEKKYTSKWVGEVETQSHHKPNPWHYNKNREWIHNSQLLPEESSIWTHPISSIPVFKTSTQGMGPQNNVLWKATGLMSTRPTRQTNGLLSTASHYTPRAQHRGGRLKCPLPEANRTTFGLSLCQHQVIKYLPKRSLHTSGTLASAVANQDILLDLLALMASRACIHQFYRTVTKSS